jgi:hypothetical protein
MKRTVVGLVALAFTARVMAGVAGLAEPEGGLKLEKRSATNSDSAEATPLPQLGPNLKVGPEVPMVPERAPAATPATEPAPAAAASPRRTLWMILAVLGVVVGSHLLRRLRDRSAPP